MADITGIQIPGGATYTLSDTYSRARIVYYRNCQTEAAAQDKVITISVLDTVIAGTVVRIRFLNAQKYNGQPNLKINKDTNTTLITAPIYNAGLNAWEAGDVVDFVYNSYNSVTGQQGTFIMVARSSAAGLDKNKVYYAKSSTSPTTQQKEATAETNIPSLYTGLHVRVRFSTAQSYDGTPTLRLTCPDSSTLGPKKIINAELDTWSGGDVIDLVYDATLDGGSGAFQVVSGKGGSGGGGSGGLTHAAVSYAATLTLANWSGSTYTYTNGSLKCGDGSVAPLISPADASSQANYNKIESADAEPGVGIVFTKKTDQTIDGDINITIVDFQ